MMAVFSEQTRRAGYAYTRAMDANRSETGVETAGAKLKALRKRTGYSVRYMAEALGMGEAHSTYDGWERESKKPYITMDRVERLTPILLGKGEPPITQQELWELAGIVRGKVDPTLKRRVIVPEPLPAPERDKTEIEILEYDVRPQGGPGGDDLREIGEDYSQPVVARWTIPIDYLSSHVADPTAVRIIRVAGDSMEPDYPAGERLAVDTSHRVPSPDGIYVLWDGFGLVVKRLAIIPGSSPRMVKLSSINPAYEPYTVPLADISINGRVIGRWQWK